jgi:hypothetical protein
MYLNHLNLNCIVRLCQTTKLLITYLDVIMEKQKLRFLSIGIKYVTSV